MSELKVFFMKKLWVDAIPGEEVTADVKFHFPQVGYNSYSIYINMCLCTLSLILGHCTQRYEES